MAETRFSSKKAATKEADIPNAGSISASQAKKLYLTAYNFFSAIAWGAVLVRTALTAATRGTDAVPGAVSVFLRWTQTMALLEVVHSAFVALLTTSGVVRAPLMTTAMQVASRLLLVWAIVYPFPSETSTSPGYTSMLLAWSLTEVIRYTFFATTLSRDSDRPVPPAFTRLRYSTFLVLYPVGIASEVYLVWLAATTPSAAPALHPLYAPALYAVLAIYVPGSYVLYTHMLAQRRKVLRRLSTEGGKKAQ